MIDVILNILILLTAVGLGAFMSYCIVASWNDSKNWWK